MRSRLRPILLAAAALALVVVVALVLPRGNGGSVVTADTAPGTTSVASSVSSSTRAATGAATTRPATTRVVKDDNGFVLVRAADLPAEARTTLALIAKGGPFPYDRDGIVFENREGLLPKKTSGYYHEYTVDTPGSDDRGARRIVAGKNGERYYTADHYATFVRVQT